MKRAATLSAGLCVALAVVRPFALQPAPTRLALELQDYAALPMTADNTNTNTRAQLARVADSTVIVSMKSCLSITDERRLNRLAFRIR